MKLIRVQDMVPNVYVDESRDFQLFCRLFDAVFNTAKFDVDSTKYLTYNDYCKSDILPLLQTKLGFFTQKKIDSEALRYIIKSFPIMVRNKGSRLGIEQAINVFLKIFHIQSSIIVTATSEGTIKQGVEIDDHSIIVEINSALKNTSILTELFRYIYPAGYSLYIFFYERIEEALSFNAEMKVNILYISDNLNSQVRGSVDDYYYSIDSQDNIVGAGPFIEVASYDSIVPTVDNTYAAGDTSKFRGIVSSLSSITNPNDLDVAISKESSDEDYETYLYNNTNWNKLTLRGVYKQLPTGSEYDVAGLDTNYIRCYYNGTNWITCNYRGYFTSTEDVIEPNENDLINIKDTLDYFVYTNNDWVELNYRGSYIKSDDVPSAEENDLVIFKGVTYYLYINNKWIDFTHYIYKKFIKEFENE